MYSSSDLGEVSLVATANTEGQHWQQHVRFSNGCNRGQLDLLRSFLRVFQEEISKIEFSKLTDAHVVITMTDKVTSAQAASKVANTLIERAQAFIARQQRQEEARLTGNGMAVHSEVKAYHGSDG